MSRALQDKVTAQTEHILDHKGNYSSFKNGKKAVFSDDIIFNIKEERKLKVI